jgi:hypothetical protein
VSSLQALQFQYIILIPYILDDYNNLYSFQKQYLDYQMEEACNMHGKDEKEYKILISVELGSSQSG